MINDKLFQKLKLIWKDEHKKIQLKFIREMAVGIRDQEGASFEESY